MVYGNEVNDCPKVNNVEVVGVVGKRSSSLEFRPARPRIILYLLRFCDRGLRSINRAPSRLETGVASTRVGVKGESVCV